MTTTTLTPRETDMQLAALWTERYKLNGKLDAIDSTILSLAGAEYYYRGRRRVTDMTLTQALDILAAHIDTIAAYKATHTVTEADGWVRTDWAEWHGPVAPYEADRPADYLAKRAAALAAREALQARIDALEATYTGWSRFFLVTSSAGHVHSSTHCSTCRPTTTFGWLPELSDKAEAEAVAELGPTLCSVCFPSAPVAWTTGKKLTAAQAARKAA